jgi:hypothetical protein
VVGRGHGNVFTSPVLSQRIMVEVVGLYVRALARLIRGLEGDELVCLEYCGDGNGDGEERQFTCLL